MATVVKPECHEGWTDMSGTVLTMRVIQHVEGWLVEMTWPEGVAYGGPVELHVRPADPDNPPEGGISQTILRQVDFRAATRDLRRDRIVVGRDGASDDKLRELAAQGLTDAYLVVVSDKYARLVGAGVEHPMQVIAEIIGRSESTVKGHLWQARKRGILTGGPGRAGGHLTEHGKAALDEALLHTLMMSHMKGTE